MKRLRELRKKANLSQEDLAQLLFTSNQSISNWETLKFMPDLDQIVKLANIFNVTVEYLLGLSNENILKIDKEKIQKLTSEQKTQIILKILEIIERG